MRHYRTNSAEAAGRVLALSMVIDGHLAPAELKVIEKDELMQYIDIDQAHFQDLLQHLCYDMLNTAVVNGVVELDRTVIDSLLEEIQEPELRRHLLRAMWSIADADGHLADAEASLLARACTLWSAESGFVGRGAQRARQLVL